MDNDNRATMLNELEEITEKYGWQIGGYNDETKDGLFTLLLISEGKGTSLEGMGRGCANSFGRLRDFLEGGFTS